MMTSLSQISIAQSLPKRARAAVVATTMGNFSVQSKAPNKTKAKPHYLNVPDHLFRKMLFSALKDETMIEKMDQLLNTPEKLQYVRDYTRLVNDFFYMKLKEDYWKNYNQLIETGSINMSPQFIKENHLHRVQFVTRENVQKRQQTIIEELKRTEERLDAHKRLAMSDSISDANLLATVVDAFVRQGQRDLSADFERRKLLLQFDMNDCRLVRVFYDLQPSLEQVRFFSLSKIDFSFPLFFSS